jgi:hypothetical protein
MNIGPPVATLAVRIGNELVLVPVNGYFTGHFY